METKKQDKTANPVGLVLYIAAILALAALIATAWAFRKEDDSIKFLGFPVWFPALAVWLPAFCVDLCGTGWKRFRDLATSLLFSAALFPVVWGATIGLTLGPERGWATLFFGPALVYGVWFWARLRRPARRETLRRYRGRLVATFVLATFLETALCWGCAVSAGGSWAFLMAVPVIAVLWAAAVAFFCAAFGLDGKKPNKETDAGDAEAAFDGADDDPGVDGDGD
ncbi:MAG: hypothetical protein IJE77_12005 [Thermoguttaceae bacterium]|nr:hypothetical protein [Thermoguttaceae bacterium]